MTRLGIRHQTVLMIFLTTVNPMVACAANPINCPEIFNSEHAIHDEKEAIHSKEAVEKGLSKLRARAEESGDDALIVLRDGKEVLKYPPGKEPSIAIETMSMTKSFVSLAIGFLVDAGKIQSLDEPVFHWFPEWNIPGKKLITLRHLLGNTSGLAANRMADDIYLQKDFVKYALEAPLKDPPGEIFFYNNRAINLLPAIVEKVSGQPVDQYLKAKLFEPLGIRSASWRHDDAGNPHGMAGLRLSADDLIKVGQMLLNNGTFDGKRILSQEWIKASITPSSSGDSGTYGLLWWVKFNDWRTSVSQAQVEEYQNAGVDSRLIRVLVEHKNDPNFRFNRLRATQPDLLQDLNRFDDLLSTGKISYPQQIPVGEPYAFAAMGSGGQELVILPKRKIIGVRQKITRASGDQEDTFQDFSKLLQRL